MSISLTDFVQLAEYGIATLVIVAMFYSMWKVFDHNKKERDKRTEEHKDERQQILTEHREERKEWRLWAVENEKRTRKVLEALTEAIKDLHKE
jgi:hypothetical protein